MLPMRTGTGPIAVARRLLVNVMFMLQSSMARNGDVCAVVVEERSSGARLAVQDPRARV